LYKLVQIQTGLLIGYIVLVPLLLFSPQATVGYVTSLGIFLVIFIINSRFLLFSLGFLAWRQGYPPARYYLFSITFDVILTLIIEPVRQGWLTLPYGLGPDSLNQFSIVVVAFGLAIALANQINLLNQQKIQAQQQALTSAREKDQLIRNQNLMLEKQVQERTQELVQANQAKSTFLANMSHELRTPLNGILGYAEILKHRPEQLDQAIAIIQRSGKHLLALIEDLLDLARIEAGRLQLNPSQVDLHDLLRNVSALIDVQANDKNLRYHIYLADTVPLYVHTDGRALRQILLNLLSNAVKFTTAGGIEFRITGQANHWVDFTIRDTGPGIKAEQITRLFEPFERGEQTHIQGVGLGLNISQRMAQLLGGDISVESQPGQGSTFTLSLPLPPLKPLPHLNSPAQITGYLGPRQQALIIDDQTENRQVLRGYLEIIGFKVLETESGMQALNLVQTHQPALILCDLLMPDVDGFTFIQTLRQQHLPFQPIVFVVSASAYPHHERLAQEAGADDFIPKPVMLAYLQRKLHQHLDLDWQTLDDPTPEPLQPPLPHPPTSLPQADWAELQEAALLGDWHALQQKIDTLRPEPQWAEVLDYLEPLINRFAIQDVQTYLGINTDDFKAEIP
jgi:signal transduction histidine kinase/CheY-like chemotaxis protein